MNEKEIIKLIDEKIKINKKRLNKGSVFWNMDKDDEDYDKYRNMYFRALGALNELRSLKLNFSSETE